MSSAELREKIERTNQGAIEAKLEQLRMGIDDLRASLEIL